MTIFILAFFVCTLITTIIIVKSKTTPVIKNELETPSPLDSHWVEESITEVFEDAPVVLESLPAAPIEDKVEEVIEATPTKKQITKGKNKSQKEKANHKINKF
jgi:hypothetical protein